MALFEEAERMLEKLLLQQIRLWLLIMDIRCQYLTLMAAGAMVCAMQDAGVIVIFLPLYRVVLFFSRRVQDPRVDAFNDTKFSKLLGRLLLH